MPNSISTLTERRFDHHVASHEPLFRKRVLRVLVLSLLLDLISFTFILPLFPKLLEFYRNVDVKSRTCYKWQPNCTRQNTLLNSILVGVNAYKNAFSRPISSSFDVILLGGALGSLFSLCQAVASPVIGRLSDLYGRRKALLGSMVGNIIAASLWYSATSFPIFLTSRIIGGLSEGNVQLAIAIATDVSNESQRSSTLALVGACFSIAFIFGPAIGALLSTITISQSNPFALAAAFSLLLVCVEAIYLYLFLPETRPINPPPSNPSAPLSPQSSKPSKIKAVKFALTPNETFQNSPLDTVSQTSSRCLLNFIHLFFILSFSGMEFSLTFLTYQYFDYNSKRNGWLLGFIGIVSSFFQGAITRKLPPLRAVQLGVISSVIAFAMLARLESEFLLYCACFLIAISSATVVTGLNSLSSFEMNPHERGSKLGNHRSFGQIGRTLGPITFCSIYWWAGRTFAYSIGCLCMLVVALFTFRYTPSSRPPITPPKLIHSD